MSKTFSQLCHLVMFAYSIGLHSFLHFFPELGKIFSSFSSKHGQLYSSSFRLSQRVETALVVLIFELFNGDIKLLFKVGNSVLRVANSGIIQIEAFRVSLDCIGFVLQPLKLLVPLLYFTQSCLNVFISYLLTVQVLFDFFGEGNTFFGHNVIIYLYVDLGSSESLIVGSRSMVILWGLDCLSGGRRLVFAHKLFEFQLSSTYHQVPSFNFRCAKSVTMLINHVFNGPNKITNSIVELVSPSIPVSGHTVPVKVFWSETSTELVK